jgi:muramoyltetrapeptide carboxypeptidase
MIQPPYLTKGNTIGIVSTARKISKKELQPAVSLLESWGLNVVYSEHLFAEDHQFAGTEAQRTSSLQAFLNDETIHAVLCARGGYGTVQIIDQLDFSKFKSHPKWIIGYSDVTTLHCHIHQNVGVETIHGTMPINFPKDGSENESTRTLKQALFGQLERIDFESHEFNQLGESEGELIGGNLSILYSLSGTNSAVNTKGKILFMEDLDEYLYHIDRMMMNLKKSGFLSGLSGIIIGGMSDMNDNAIPFGKTALEIIKERTADLNIPIAFNFPAGHCEPNKALIFGRKCSLKVQENGSSLSF